MCMKDDTLCEFAGMLARMPDARRMAECLQALLTPRERRRLALRWRIVCLLRAGARQRDIARRLGISLCNITRGSRELKRGPAGFRSLVDEHVKENRNKKGRNKP